MSSEPGDARSYLYRVEVDETALLVATLRRRMRAGGGASSKAEALSKWHKIRVRRSRSSSPPAGTPTTLCRHPIVGKSPEQVLVRRAYRAVSESEEWRVWRPSDWGRRWSVDRRELRQSGAVYHKTANDWFFLRREAAERAARRYESGEGGALAETTSEGEEASREEAGQREANRSGAGRCVPGR